MPNITNITPPRVPLTDIKTGNITREWYRFLLNLFTVSYSTSDGTQDLLLGGYTPEAQFGTITSLNYDSIDYFGFQTTPNVPTAPPVGTVWWGGGTTLNMQMTSDVAQKVGESQYYYVKASGTVTKGQLTMFTGVVTASGVITVAPSTGLTDGQYLIGIATEDIAVNGFGLVQNFGVLSGINTNAFSEGDFLYYDPTTPGGLTNTQPTAPNVKATVATVITKSASVGAIMIRVSTGSILGGTDSNVQFSGLADNNLISYDATAQYWKNITPSNINYGFTSTRVIFASSTGTLTTDAGFTYNSTTNTLNSDNAAFSGATQTLAAIANITNDNGGYGSRIETTVNTSNSSVTTYGSLNYGNLNLSGGTGSSLRNTQYQATINITNSASGFVRNLIPTASIEGSSPTGTLTEYSGVQIPATSYSGITGTPVIAITAYYGLNVANQGSVTAGVTKTTSYGVFVAAQSGATNTWAVYSAGGSNAFVGETRFGATTAPVNTVDITGSLGRGAPVTKTGNFTLAATENWIIVNNAGSTTVTLPAASSWTGREVTFKTIQAQTLVSASSNVVPSTSATAGTAVLPATDGAWATLVSNGTNWVIMAATPLV